VPQLLFDDFSSLPVGPLPTDWSAVGEYHYVQPTGEMGPWHEPIRSYQWRGNAPWLVLEDDGRHRLLQTIGPGKNWPRILVAGEDWTDYSVTVRLQPLRHDGFVGVAFRYRTGRSHYRAGFEAGKLVLLRVNHEETLILAEAPFAHDCSEPLALQVTARGPSLSVAVEGEKLLEAQDETFAAGRVALVATTTAFFDEIAVETTEEVHAAWVQSRDARVRELDALRERYPRPVLWRKLPTTGFGTGRHIRFGHLASRDRLDILVAQNVKLLPGNDNYGTIRCLTALDLDGNILWQFGEPSDDPDAAILTADLPVQIYDIDGDGRDEVLCVKNFKLYILDGATSEVKNCRPLPTKPRAEDQFGRLVGDAITIANFRGTPRPADILVKNRYKQLWAFDDRLEPLWTHDVGESSTGHFPQPYDFDGDGRDELLCGYRLLGPDGEVIWSLPWGDHTDEIAIGPFDPERPGVQIALVCGEAGFNIVAPDGQVLHREFLGHAQRLSAARFRADLPGLQFYVVTYWGWAGIVSFHDCTGRKLFELEPTALGSILNPVNWTGRPEELALLSGSVRHGGMLDGWGRRVVLFPDDGHPEMCAEALDLTGDPRDEIVLWDPGAIWIYTQDRPPETPELYRPVRYPHYNASNYRAEVSVPRDHSRRGRKEDKE